MGCSPPPIRFSVLAYLVNDEHRVALDYKLLGSESNCRKKAEKQSFVFCLIVSLVVTDVLVTAARKQRQ